MFALVSKLAMLNFFNPVSEYYRRKQRRQMTKIAKLILLTLLYGWAGVTQAVAEPTVTSITTDDMIPAAVQKIWTNDFEPCDNENEDVSEMISGMRISFSKNAPGSGLYILLCGGPGTYNKPFVIFAHDAERDFVRAVILPIMQDQGPSVQTEIYNVSWNNSLRQLSAFGKNRGLADCGAKMIWKWAFDTIESDFVLLEHRVKDECDGKQG